jgi:hypothetical protein
MYPDPEIQQRARQRMAQMREGDDLRHERWEISCADGSKKTVGISSSILTTADGSTHALALMHHRRRLDTRTGFDAGCHKRDSIPQATRESHGETGRPTVNLCIMQKDSGRERRLAGT